jgi:hypothetical protein
MTLLRSPHQTTANIVIAIAAVAIVAIIALLAGCASTDVPKPLVGEVRSATVYVPTPVPCTDETKLSKRPPVHAAPVGADAVRHMSGVKADAEDLGLYATELEAEIRRCSTLPTNGGK